MAKVPGPLHPLPIPDKRFDSVAIDFVGPLPVDNGFDGIVMMTDRLGADVQIVPCKMDMMAEEFAEIFFGVWYCENGCLLEIISDCDRLFMSKFWKALMKLARVKHKMSMSYHPETDGLSERSNKMVILCLRYHVERNQTGWVKALPKVHFDIMNMVNVSMQVSPFILKTGRSPRVLLPLVANMDEGPAQEEDEEKQAQELIERINGEVDRVKDCLLAAKITQVHHANKDRGSDPELMVGEKVMMKTAHCRCEYM